MWAISESNISFFTVGDFLLFSIIVSIILVIFLGILDAEAAKKATQEWEFLYKTCQYKPVDPKLNMTYTHFFEVGV